MSETDYCHCDRCGNRCGQLFGGVELQAGGCWCKRCCVETGIADHFAWTRRAPKPGAAENANAIRDRWLADQAARRRERLAEFLASKGKDL
jgi:hypothetical protein